jgi:hypothetical protein
VLNQFLENSSDKELSRTLISTYKNIRESHLLYPNPTSKVFYNLSKLICVVFTGNTSILKDGNLELGQLLAVVNTDIDKLPLSIDRFYLKNINTHVYAKHLANINKPELSIQILTRKTELNLFEANNFNFPNHVSKDQYSVKDQESIFNIEKKETKSTIYRNHNFLKGDFFYTILN